MNWFNNLFCVEFPNSLKATLGLPFDSLQVFWTGAILPIVTIVSAWLFILTMLMLVASTCTVCLINFFGNTDAGKIRVLVADAVINIAMWLLTTICSTWMIALATSSILCSAVGAAIFIILSLLLVRFINAQFQFW